MGGDNIPKIPFDELKIKPQNRDKRQHDMIYTCNGLDTETYLGKCKIICDSSGNWVEPKDFDELAFFLTRNRFSNAAWNFFFNIRFDFQSIIKWLPNDYIYELYHTKETTYKNYDIQYIPGKFFKIRFLDNQFAPYYDLANFLDGSLNYLANKYLHKQKLDIIDSARLNVDIEYWNNNFFDIVKYCKVDAALTKELADYFWNLMKKSINFLPYNPFSKGSVAQEYFLFKSYIPKLDDFLTNECRINILRFAYESYSGGRFELLKRGYAKKVYLYDIKSAYPKEISQLIDYNHGIWYKTTHFDKYKYGFWYCDIDFYHPIVSPFMQKLYGLNIYPNGHFRQYLNKQELDFILEYFKEVNIEVISGYGFIPKTIVHPFYVEINNLYYLKENEKNEELKQVYKILMNSIYGKFQQTIGGETGKLFNPLWSSLITGNTRIKLLKTALDNDINSIIGFSTDSIFTEKPLKIIEDKSLGSWELKYEGTDGIFLMSDIYSIKTKDGDKHKLRGFKIKLKSTDTEDKYITVYNILNYLKNDTIFKYKVSRPMNLGETIMQYKKKDLSMLNVWKEDIREININGDTKRFWERDFETATEALTDMHTSEPLYLDHNIFTELLGV